MALIVADIGEVLLLDQLLSGSSGGNFILKLYNNNVTPTNASTTASFTEATFTNYAAKTLTRASWGAASTVSNKGSSTYATQNWTAGSSETIYGYFVISGTTLLWAEKFGTARGLVSNDILNVVPVFTFNSEN